MTASHPDFIIACADCHISCNAVAHLTKNFGRPFQDGLMAYFYCDFGRSGSDDPFNVIGSLVGQLCSQIDWYPDELESAFDRSGSHVGQRRRPTFTVLKQVLLLLAKDNRITLLIDGLDECGGREEILEFVSSLGEEDGNISMLITSRNELEIQEALKFFTAVRIENRLKEMNRDIQNYVNHRFQSDKKLQKLSNSVKNDIANAMMFKSSGM
jgi:hypothetical protein